MRSRCCRSSSAPGKVKFAQGMKAGRWVFATGVMAQDFKSGIAADVLAERAPHAGLPKREKEALRIFENIDAVLRAAGTDRTNLVRTDQYYTTVKAVPPYQQVRREFLARPHPAVDLDRPAGPAAARRRHEHPGARRHPAAGLRGRRIIKHEALRRPADLGLFAGAHRRRFHLHSRHHLARDRRRAAAQRRRRGGADDRGHAMGRPADQARDRVHHHAAHGAVAGAGRRHARGRGPRPGLSHRPRGLFRLQRGMDAALREVAADARHHPLHRRTALRPTTARSRSTCSR